MSTYLLLVLAIACEVLGTVSLKLSKGFTRPVWDMVVIAGYLASFVLLAIVLRRGMPVSVAYAVWAAVGVVAVALIGVLFLNERLSGVQLVGIALVVGGVVALELGAVQA